MKIKLKGGVILGVIRLLLKNRGVIALFLLYAFNFLTVYRVLLWLAFDGLARSITIVEPKTEIDWGLLKWLAIHVLVNILLVIPVKRKWIHLSFGSILALLMGYLIFLYEPESQWREITE